jgi:hypothetical protein
VRCDNIEALDMDFDLPPAVLSAEPNKMFLRDCPLDSAVGAPIWRKPLFHPSADVTL